MDTVTSIASTLVVYAAPFPRAGVAAFLTAVSSTDGAPKTTDVVNDACRPLNY